MRADDLTAPMKREEITALSRDETIEKKNANVDKILGLLNERRDAYNGIVSTLIYIIETKDDCLLGHLKQGLVWLITSHPMRYGGKMFITRCLPRLVREQPEFVATLFSLVMLEMGTVEKCSSMAVMDSLRIKIAALKAINQAEQRVAANLTTMEQLEIDTICDEAISKGDEATKVDTLYLILDTRVTTKLFQERDFEIFKRVFEVALDFQIPTLRQKFLAITNKVMKRMRDSIRVVMREQREPGRKFSEEQRKNILEQYTTFLEWLVKSCLDNIYCNKYFGSFIITMSTLNYIIEHIGLDNPNLPIEHLFKDRRYYDSILSCISLDSFEENKILALKLLFALPNYEHFVFDKNLQLFEDIAYRLVHSVNPAHSLTCQYIFKLVIGFKHRETNIRKNRLIYEHLDRLVALVEDGIELTKSDFLEAFKNNAIYPKLTCIRALLSEVDVKDLQDDHDDWTRLVNRIVKASIEACQEISTIVCNMNPETIGHVPMDLKPIDVKTLSKKYEVSVKMSHNHLQTVTSQHLLITGWKTIKECSLSMATMCSQFWWPKDDKYLKNERAVLDSTAIKLIISFFEHYLRNLRHRGAFEQAYNGFVLVTKRIWLEEEFKELLIGSLKTIMSDFTGKQDELDDKKVEYLKNHVTRRSAGLPFLVQAIVVSEDKQESKTLEWAMNCLLDILEDSKGETYQKIHCLNILKALIKDYNLGEKVIPFIERTILVTIESFKSDEFPIRNCANMLMRVVVDRTFGVNRLRDDIHKRNTLSFEKFFTEYPNLFNKMLGYLSEGLVDRKALASVHAVIIILVRLRPSLEPGEDYTPEKVILPFVKPLLELAQTCPDLKLRELSANLAVQLESYCVKTDAELVQLFVSKILELTRQAIESVASKGNERIDRNELHGKLSMLKAWLARCDVLRESEKETRKIKERIEELVRTVAYGDINFSMYDSGQWLMNEDLTNFFNTFKRKFGPSASTIRLISLDLIELLYLNLPDSGRYYVSRELLVLLKLESETDWEPYHENMIFKMFSTLVASRFISYDTEIVRFLLSKIVNIITGKSKRKYSLNLQASLVRLIRHLYYRIEDFSDKLMLNLDLDSTAAMLTPVDQMNQSSKLDSDQEKWSQHCDKGLLMDSKLIMLQVVHPLLDFSQYREFALPPTNVTHWKYRETGAEAYRNEQKRSRVIKPLSPSVVNTPRSIELMALACKTYDMYMKNDDEKPCRTYGVEPIHDRLVFSTRLIKSLPDCDIKCLTLLFASKLFRKQLAELHEQSKFEFKTFTFNVELLALKEFSELMEALVDCQHDRMTRETCTHILSNTIKLALDCWSQDLKDTVMNLLSTLIKLCQDEESEVRQASLDIVSNLHRSHFPDALDQNGKLDKLIVVITEKLLDPKKAQDAMDLFDLFTRVIFNHSKNFSVNQSEERESLFDKTKPNIFADHVASIHNTFRSAKEFFKQIERVDINTMKFSPQVVMELEYSYTTTHSEQCTGDYSWRLKDAVKSQDNSDVNQEIDSRKMLNEALNNVHQSLGYFNYSNMLTDTNFGFHESSIFKRLAFVKLIVDFTNQDDCTMQLLNQVQKGLDNTINQSCATTILCKCRELLVD